MSKVNKIRKEILEKESCSKEVRGALLMLLDWMRIVHPKKEPSAIRELESGGLAVRFGKKDKNWFEAAAESGGRCSIFYNGRCDTEWAALEFDEIELIKGESVY